MVAFLVHAFNTPYCSATAGQMIGVAIVIACAGAGVALIYLYLIRPLISLWKTPR